MLASDAMTSPALADSSPGLDPRATASDFPHPESIQPEVKPDPDTKTDNDDTISPASDHKRTDNYDEEPGSPKDIESGKEAAKKKFQLQDIRPAGASKHFNPTSVDTRVRFGGELGGASPGGAPGQAAPGGSNPNQDYALLWRSRDNRKGRSSIAVPVPESRRGSMAVPVSPRGGSITMRLVFPMKDVGKNIVRMFTTLQYWDMAWWSGWSYTLGSILFVIDGAWAWGPLAFPSTSWPGEDKYGVPLCFFFGALFYQIGATMAYFEAINDGSFAGSAMKRFLQGHEEDQKKLLDEKLHGFFGHVIPHHGSRSNPEEPEKQEENLDSNVGGDARDQRRPPGSAYPGSMRVAPRRGGVDYGETEEGEQAEYTKWRWWPTWNRLRTHHMYEVGYISCAIQLFGATLYAICGVVALPGVLSSLNQWQTNAAYWIPQIVASVCFLTAAFGFTVETQLKWWKPEPGVLGWWIGAWAAVGSMGFLLCGSLGPATFTNTGAAYQSDLSSLWGSAAYLISSVLQWYEAVNKHPVSFLLNER